MTDPMSEDAQILRARKARHILSHAISSVITRRIAQDLTNAFVPADRSPVATAHYPETAVSPTESWIEKRLAVLNETGWRAQDPPDRPVDPPVDSDAAYTPDPKAHAIDDMRDMLSGAHARLTTTQGPGTRLLHTGSRQGTGHGTDDPSGA